MAPSQAGSGRTRWPGWKRLLRKRTKRCLTGAEWFWRTQPLSTSVVSQRREPKQATMLLPQHSGRACMVGG